ncbi:NIPSNAP family protein [Kitasatospora sp. KL5]|uniref:NIPSNAP family protein n=1 Tax=Kitasatospora sp. KL5 TaxID=3425125 RepID=UPI003D6E6351
MIVEVRTYRLKPGTGEEFVRVMREESVPLLEQAGITVLGCGASLFAEEGHEEAYLIRSFASLAEHREQEQRFYDSAAWTDGPREAIVSRIEQYHTVVFEVDEAGVQAFRATAAGSS